MIKKSLLLSILVASFSATAMVRNESADTTPANDTSRNDDRSCDRVDSDGYVYDNAGFIVDRVEHDSPKTCYDWPRDYDEPGYDSSKYDTHLCVGPTPGEQQANYDNDRAEQDRQDEREWQSREDFIEYLNNQ